MTDLKTRLADFNQQQRLAFPAQNVITLLHQRSDFYDALLVELWQQLALDNEPNLALVAVGGYGRREMFPLSDLDILVLSDTPVSDEIQQQLNTLFNQLWDSKLQLGATVRTLAECIDIGKAEISVATNILESRFLVGNQALWQTLMARIYQDDFWPIRDFFHAKMAEKEARYARYHNTSYNLEPDLKHSPGGLRDLHLISWIMLRHYGIHTLAALFEKGILFAKEYQELAHAQEILFRMRFGLHLQLKRYDNRLRFDRQLQLSEQLGYAGNGNQAVEAMMRTFFQATQSISQLSQLLLNSFAQAQFSAPENGRRTDLDRHFYLNGNTIFCHDPAIFSEQPHTILDLFFHLTQQPHATASSTMLRQLRLALHTLAQPLSTFAEARQRFIQLFAQPNAIRLAIVPMHQLSVLSAYLPQWKQIEGLMQFDMFHIYTVDEHSVRVMLKLESFLSAENREMHPLCCEIFPQLAERSLIYLAALFHDIGKGREGDHAELGAVEMRHFAEQHGFDRAQTDFMAWLVAEHLTMSITAQRRDIHDPDIVKTFAEKVQNPLHLSALTCLTVADICATNETLWNDWKRSLFRKLFQFTHAQLQLGEVSLDYQKIGDSHRAEALAELKLLIEPHHYPPLTDFWAPCPPSYFVRNTPTQLVWHALGYLKQGTQPMVLISNQYARGATEIFVYCYDQPQLFTRIAHTLSQKKISIHDAQIITSQNGLVFDSFIVTESNGQPLTNERSEQVQQALYHTLNNKTAFKPTKTALKAQPFTRKTKVRFLPDTHPNQTAFELFTLDREGLLAQLGNLFNQQGLNLVNAKISTIGERVEDFFVLTTQQQRALNEQEKALLKQQIMAEF